MDQPEHNRPLYEIETPWSDVLRAHRGEGEVHAARARLVLRYIGAVRHYMSRILRDEDAAGELAQEFAVRMLRGDFRRADPSRGRFRDFVRTAALNLVQDYRRRCKARPRTRSAEYEEPAAPLVESDELDREFLQSWRMELLNRAMASLAAFQQRTGRPYHEVIKLRTRDPGLSSRQMAACFSVESGKPVNETWVRQTLRRARGYLADLLLDEVSASLEHASLEEIEQELITLDLLGYCQEGLRRRARRHQSSALS